VLGSGCGRSVNVSRGPAARATIGSAFADVTAGFA